MTPLLLTLALVAGCGGPSGSGAEEAPAGSYDRVAFVDMGRIIRETRHGRRILAQLGEAERQVQQRLADLQAELDTILEDLEAAQAEPSPDQARLAQLASEYRATGEEAERVQSLGRQQLEEYRTELTVPLLTEVRQVCEDIGMDDGYGLIVDRTAVAYAVRAIDLTDRVIEEIGGSANESVLIDEALRAPVEDPPPDGAEPADPEDPEASGAP